MVESRSWPIGLKHTTRQLSAEYSNRQATGTSHSPIWWRHQMETFSALLAICVGNSPVTGGVFFDLRIE